MQQRRHFGNDVCGNILCCLPGGLEKPLCDLCIFEIYMAFRRFRVNCADLVLQRHFASHSKVTTLINCCINASEAA